MKLTITTKDKFEAACFLKAVDMACQINSIYEQVFRKYKHIDLSESEYRIKEDIRNEIREHFEGLYIEET